MKYILALDQGTTSSRAILFDQQARIVTPDHGREAPQRRGGVVGRQQHAALRKTGTFLQMQVGDDEQPLFFPDAGKKDSEVGK